MDLALHLEDLYKKYNKPEFLNMDPLLVVHRFKGAKNIEIAGLVAASLAYGRFELIIRALDDNFSRIKVYLFKIKIKT